MDKPSLVLTWTQALPFLLAAAHAELLLADSPKEYNSATIDGPGHDALRRLAAAADAVAADIPALREDLRYAEIGTDSLRMQSFDRCREFVYRHGRGLAPIPAHMDTTAGGAS